MQDWCEGADRAGLQLEVHAIGTSAVDLTLDMFAAIARKNGPRDRRSRIEHAQHINPGSIGRFAQARRDRLDAALSRDRRRALGGGAARARPDRRQLGIPLLARFGRDPDLRFGLAGRAGRSPRRDRGRGSARDDRRQGRVRRRQRITVAEALHAYTAANAFAGFQEGKLGSLSPGKLADLVVLDSDIFQIAPERIGETRVLRTIVDGKERYADSAA